MIKYKCACGTAGNAQSGIPKTCQKCGAILTMGDYVAAHIPPLTMETAKKAVLRYLGTGADAPLLTPRQRQDRIAHLRKTLAGLKADKVNDLREGDLPKLMEALEIRP